MPQMPASMRAVSAESEAGLLKMRARDGMAITRSRGVTESGLTRATPGARV
jgi:hypothetical protein